LNQLNLIKNNRLETFGKKYNEICFNTSEDEVIALLNFRSIAADFQE